MSYLVGNPEDRFSPVAAHLVGAWLTALTEPVRELVNCFSSAEITSTDCCGYRSRN